MIRIIFFNILYIGTCGFALVRGGLPERIAMVILIADFQLSHWLIKPLGFRYNGVEEAMFAIDAMAFIAFYLMSLFSTRFWPIWMAAFQACVVAGHASGMRTDVIPLAYGNYVALWSYLLLSLLLAGTIRHRRRIARYGHDPSWRWHLPIRYREGDTVDAAHNVSERDPAAARKDADFSRRDALAAGSA